MTLSAITDLLHGFGAWTLAWTALIVFGCAVLRGFAGFGFAIAAVPLMSLVLPPTQAVPVAVVLQLFAGVTDFRSASAEADWPSIRWLTLGAAIGSPLGVAALAVVSVATSRLLIGAIAAVGVAAVASQYRLATTPRGSAIAGVGLAAGLFNGLAAMPGPPVVAYYMVTPLTREAVRASLLVFFLLTAIASSVSLVAFDLFGLAEAVLTLFMVPIMLVGTTLGRWMFARDGRAHRNVTLVILAAISLTSLVRGLIDLI